MKKKKEAAGARSESSGITRKRTRRSHQDETAADLISRQPDAILCTIISLLPTKDGGRTPALNLERSESWFDSRALCNLEELDIGYEYLSGRKTSYPLPQSALRASSSTLLVCKISYCDFPKMITPSMNFPLLKELSLSSPTIRSIGFRDNSGEKAELVIEDAPRLERLLLPYWHRDDCVIIQVISAPKLEILGPFSPVFYKFWVFQGMDPVSSANSIRTVKVLALGCSNHQLNAVLDVLRWFPCLEKLYVTSRAHDSMLEQNEDQHDPPYPVECLETHLKEVVLKLFIGYEHQVNFARFFVLNAKVLNKIEFQGCEDYSNELVARQHRLLQFENRASRDARFEFRNIYFCIDEHVEKHVHDLSLADPFSDSHR
ncbi:uncharacterized protein [Aegilops tauschii subsp. strangulata]|uniref:uncharacterized protein n=1 Tax=Aegilops tauschii subsp. strangulata TaxID=200361 RepID=UPI003CC8857F